MDDVPEKYLDDLVMMMKGISKSIEAIREDLHYLAEIKDDEQLEIIEGR